jgi:transketolase
MLTPLTDLEKRIIDISYKHKLSHIGSCLNAVDVIESCYQSMQEGDKFVLSSGHSFLALATVLEKYKGKDAEALVVKHGTHPNEDKEDEIFVSTGSLGQGLPIAVGMAIADPSHYVYVVSSDGEMNEGSMWEALRIAGELRLENLRIAIVANGYSAYGRTDVDLLEERVRMFYPAMVVKTDLFKFPGWIQGLQGHYQIMTEEQYKEVQNG